MINCVDLHSFTEEIIDIERKVLAVVNTNSMLEIRLEEAADVMRFSQVKEKSLIEERDSLLVTVNRLQQTLQEQCNLRVENERLRKDMVKMKEKNERRAEDREAELQRLVAEMRAAAERHQRELEAVRRQCRREVEEAQREALHLLDVKDAEVNALLEEKDVNVEKLKKRLKEQEKEKQSELLKLQMEFGAKLARVQSAAQQQQQYGSNPLPQSVYKRKLQFFQEEKNKEIVALRQRIKELEQNQSAGFLSDSRLKRRRV